MAAGRIAVSSVGGGLLAVALGIATPAVKELEGRRNLPYYDIVNVLTVCDGYAGPLIVPDKKYTDEECDNLTTTEIEKYSSSILKISPHLEWHPMVLASVISFTYNIGTTAYAKSSVARLINEGKFQEGCAFMLKYKYAGGKVLTGLVNRRQYEYSICTATLTAEGMKNVRINNS